MRPVGRHWLAGPILYAVAFALARVSVPLSLVVYAALIVYFAISGPWLARRLFRLTGHGAPGGAADA